MLLPVGEEWEGEKCCCQWGKSGKVKNAAASMEGWEGEKCCCQYGGVGSCKMLLPVGEDWEGGYCGIRCCMVVFVYW